MLSVALLSLYKSLKERYMAWAATNTGYAFWSAFGLCFFCITVSFPSYELFLEPNEIVLRNWAVLQNQIAEPFTPHAYPAEDHAGQLAYRVFLPYLAHILHLPLAFFFWVMPLLGWLFFRLIFTLGHRLSMSSWESLLLALGMAATYVGKAFFVDVLGYFDAICFLLLLVSLLYKPLASVSVCFLACLFIDERAYLAVPLVAVARFFILYKGSNGRRLWIEALTAGLFLMVGLSIRWYLHQRFGLSNGTSSENLGLQTIRNNFQISAIGLLTGLEFWSFAAFLPAFYLWKLQKSWLGIGYGLYLAGCFVAMLIVLDLTRCTAYLFPAVLAAVGAIAYHETPTFRERFLVFFTGTALLFPPLFVVGDYILWMGPILPKVIRVVASLGFGVHL